MDICAVCTIIVATVGAAQVIDGLPGEGLGGKTGAANDLLAVGIGVAGVSCLVAGHGSIEIVKYCSDWIYTCNIAVCVDFFSSFSATTMRMAMTA